MMLNLIKFSNKWERCDHIFPVGAKLLRLFINRINNRLNELKFFNAKQYGFVKGRSTVDAIDELLKNIDNSLPSFKYSVLISIDMSGAFDNISWKHILNNLIKSNIESQYVLAAESLLIGRKIFINENAFKTNKDCPQG